MSALENETLHDTTTFDHFDRSWSVPTKRHMSHLIALRDGARSGFGDINVLVAETFLGPEQFDALLAIDPDEEALDAFVADISKALGLGDSGNS